MKSQSFSRSTKPKLQETKLDTTGRKGAACKSKACESLHMKPFTGRIFYLDLPCNKRSQTLERDITNLGGTVEKFFSKDIRYLVSSRPEARHVHQLTQDSPVPSPDSGLSSPHPASKRDSHGHRGSSQGLTDTLVVSRGKSLVERVVKEQERIHVNRILANALEWGVKILYIDDVISYIDKKKSNLAPLKTTTHTLKKATKLEQKEKMSFQKCSGGRIRQPFVKVEDSSRHYRPLYLQMANMPVCNLSSATPCSPFLGEELDSPGKKPARVQGSPTDQGIKSRKDKRRGHEGRNRRKGGYCECCQVKFESLKAHLQGAQHQAFSKSEEYLVVDRVISGLTCDLTHLGTQKKRVKCSMSSPLLIPGPIVRRDLQDAVMRGTEEEGVIEKLSLWGPLNTERNSEKPSALRKRCRESSLSPGEDGAELTGAVGKSQSKRGSFRMESISNAALQNTFGTSNSGTGQHCFSDPLERNSKVCSKSQSQHSRSSQQRVKSLDFVSSGQKPQTTHRSTGVQKSPCANVVSDPSGFFLEVKTVQKPLSDYTERVTLQPRAQPSFGDGAIKTEIPAVLAQKSPSTGEHERVSTDSPPRTLLRKVRDMRSRRKAPEGVLPVKQEAAPTPKLPDFSASVMDLWQLFQSSSSTEDDFMGF